MDWVKTAIFALGVLLVLGIAGHQALRLLQRRGLTRRRARGPSLEERERLLLRYDHQGASILMFAWLKTRWDPMFFELPQILQPYPGIERFVDIGCGFGCAASFFLEKYPSARVWAIDPNPRRVRAAQKAFGDRGQAFVAAAPDFLGPLAPGPFDAALLLDVLLFLDDAQLDMTLSRIRGLLKTGGLMLIRAGLAPGGGGSMAWRLARVFRALRGTPVHFRSVQKLSEKICGAGFDLAQCRQSGPTSELQWFVAIATDQAPETSASVAGKPASKSPMPAGQRDQT